LQLRPLESLPKPIEFEVLVVYYTGDDPLVVLEVKDEELELLAKVFTKADIDLGFNSCHVKWRLRCACRQHHVCQEQAVLGLAEMTGLKVGVRQGKAVLAPFLHQAVLISLLMLKEVALA